MSGGMIILAVLLPPVAVAVRYGLSGTFFLNLLLSLLGWLPGVIHALWVLSKGGQVPRY